MAASYPTSVKEFSHAENKLDKITALKTMVLEIQAEVAALETATVGLTATGVEINNHCDLDTLQAMTEDGAITIKNGIVTLDKAGVLAATLAAPAAGDNGKTLTVYSLSAQAHTVTITGSAGGTATDVATFGAAIGNCITLRAYGEKWYNAGVLGVTVA